MILQGRTIVVTGSGPGMNGKLATLAAREGARVVLMLLSDYTSQVTGAAYDVNGGEHFSL